MVERVQIKYMNPRVVAAGSDGTGLPTIARLGLKRVGVFVADIA